MLTTRTMDQIVHAAAWSVLARIDGMAERASVRTQAAVVRSLVHELELRSSWDGIYASLLDQLEEELMRLTQLVLAPRHEEGQLRAAAC